MTTKEKLQFGLQVFIVLIFATLANKAIDNKPVHDFKGALAMKGENMFIMEMDNMDSFDLKEIGDIDIEDKMEVKVEKEIINGEETMKVTVNGKEISANEYKRFKSKNGSWKSQKGPKAIMKKKMMHHKSKVCETCEEKQMMCEDCKDKS
jgi:hypothetical protein